MFTQEQISLVSSVDDWAQQNKPVVDNKFSKIYGRSDGGWSGMATNEPVRFAQALCIALEWRGEANE